MAEDDYEDSVAGLTERRRALAAERAQIEADQAAVLDAPEDRKCSHCDSGAVVARSLCGACYRYQRRHGGELPPIDGEVIRARRWAREFPVTSR